MYKVYCDNYNYMSNDIYWQDNYNEIINNSNEKIYKYDKISSNIILFIIGQKEEKHV